ncbi:MAG: hypothetical protein QOJ63_2570 [Solirubrobacteraceae bacterium]|nr:hypothetical protein [Solirubrobacteraceae bacterium]
MLITRLQFAFGVLVGVALGGLLVGLVLLGRRSTSTEEATPLEPLPDNRAERDEKMLARLAEPTPRTAWRILARNQARALFDQVREAECIIQQVSDGQKCYIRLICEGIFRAVSAAAYSPSRWRERLKDWFSGAGIETACAELHRCDELMLFVQDPVTVKERILDIDAALRSNLKEDDSRLTPATTRLADLAKLRPAKMTAAVREELRAYQRLANITGDKAYANVRSQRNLLIIVGFIVSAGLIWVASLHAVAPGFMDLATHKKGAPDAVEVWEVIVVGAMGGTIAGVFTVSKLGGFSGAYRLPVYQALIRIPAGALVALAAVLVLQSGQFGTVDPQSGLSVLVTALVFGYAPDVLLRAMDQKATSLLGQAQNKDDPARPPLARPRAV